MLFRSVVGGNHLSFEAIDEQALNTTFITDTLSHKIYQADGGLKRKNFSEQERGFLGDCLTTAAKGLPSMSLWTDYPLSFIEDEGFVLSSGKVSWDQRIGGLWDTHALSPYGIVHSHYLRGRKRLMGQEEQEKEILRLMGGR